MRSVNKVILIGHVAAEPEIRETQKGQKFAIFPIATNRDWVDTDKKKEAITVDFHKIVSWGKNVEIIEKYVTKGMGLYVEGRLMNRTYEAPDKTKRFTTEISLEQFSMLTWKKKNGVEQVNLKEPEDE